MCVQPNLNITEKIVRKKSQTAELSANVTRVIGIRHRVKRSAEGEPRPTQLAVKIGDELSTTQLTDEMTELDFVQNGIRPGDVILMTLGGSGDNLAFALSRALEPIGGCVLRLPPRLLKDYRDQTQKDKDDDSLLLIEIFTKNPKAFYAVETRDRKMIIVRERFRARTDAMKARIACEQRILSSLIGSIFCSEEGMYPQGEIEKAFDEAKANDVILRALLEEEAKRNKRLEAALKDTAVYRQLFMPITGVGPAIAARIIAPISDIRLFMVEPDPIELKRLSDEINQIERAVFEPIKNQLAGEFARRSKDWQGMGPGELHFMQLGVAASWLKGRGQTDGFKQLQKALELHQQRSALRRQALSKGRAKFRHFCGTFLVTDDKGKWIQARKRRGQVCNWNPEVKQALFLLGDQFNRRPETYWGQRFRQYKVSLRATHPEVELTENGKKRYTNGHIHKMATWSTLAKFVDWLFDAWLELELKGEIAKAKAT